MPSAPSPADWDLQPSVTYLNHGSFGPSPRVVNEERMRLAAELEANPMEFFVRRQEPLLVEATRSLAGFVGCDEHHLVIVDNATVGMNIVAANYPLAAGDEVLLTNHEYGAVHRTWERACRRAGANLAVVEIPFPSRDNQAIADTITAAFTPRTRMLVVSHISSGTATIFPAAEICAEARRRGIATCIDGPHAIAQIPLDIAALDCDYYTASCHKWLCGPFGTGFLYARSPEDPPLEPLVQSWGRLAPAKPEAWQQEFWWSGTRDLSAYLALPTAIEFMRNAGLKDFREASHELAMYARERICQAIGRRPFLSERDDWFGSMVPLPLTDCDPDQLRTDLHEQHNIEVHAYRWQDRPIIRVSCHWYNDQSQIDLLGEALEKLID